MVKSRLEALGPLIVQICNITGTPGVSLGVLYDGEILHTASYGFQDVERQVEPNVDTSFLVCSMTKAITASMIGMVIDEGKLDFSTQLYQIGAAGAIRSSISDLLVLYKALINAANSQVVQRSVSGAKNVFKQMPQLLQGKIGVPNQSLREYSYASGWIRAELPAIVDLFADYEPPLLGSGSASRLMIHHQGYIAGNVGYVALFPETSTAVVVLGNSAGLTDTMRLLGQVIVETVLGNEVDADTYLNTAIAASKNTIESVNTVHKELLAGKTIDQPTRDITAYTGRYYNVIENFFIDIIEIDGRIQVAYMGSSNDTFDLIPYESDSFFWWLDFNESANRARLPGYPKEYFILKFSCPSTSSWLRSRTDAEMGCLTWKHEFQLAGPGEAFRKKTRNPYSEVFGTFGIFKELR